MAFNFFRQLQKRNRDFETEIDGVMFPVKVVENDRAKRLTLRLSPANDALKVTTPSHVGDDEIYDFIERNRNWAAVRISRAPKKIDLVEGAIIPYLGIDHKIVATGKARGVVEILTDADETRILVPGDPENISSKLVAWLKKQARQELNDAVSRHCATIGKRPKQIRITDTTSRWGSCSSNRVLSFSWRIIMAPPEVLDYLAAHECAHLIEMNHSDRFWDLTRSLCPNMESHKAWLRTNATKLHSISV